jgi:transposase
MPKSPTKHDLQLEERRLRAWELKQQGWQQNKIAQEVGVTPGAVSQWFKRARQKGSQALHTRKGGPRPLLQAEQIQQLPNLLAQSPQSYGLFGTVWTRTNILMLIRQVYAVQYSHGHIGRILRKSGVKLRLRRRATRMRRPLVK